MNILKATIATAAVVVCSLGNDYPAKASLNEFCGAVKNANRMGASAAPGSAFSKAAIASQNGSVTSSQYRMVWAIAKESNNWTCRGIF